MRVDQLQAVIMVATTQSITTAAEILYISQPSLSRTIQSLEKELGVLLFERNSSGVRLTDSGESLLPFIKKTLDDILQLNLKAKELVTQQSLAEGKENTLKILALQLVADSILVLALDELKIAYPQIKTQITIHNNLSPFLIPNLTDYDLFIGSDVENSLESTIKLSTINHNLERKDLFVEKFSIVINQTHPLALKKAVTFDEVVEHQLVLHDYGVAVNELYANGISSEKNINVIFKSNNSRVLTDILINQEVLLITTDIFIKHDFRANKNLKIIPIKNLKIRYFCLFVKENSNSQAIEEIIAILKYTQAKLANQV